MCHNTIRTTTAVVKMHPPHHWIRDQSNHDIVINQLHSQSLKAQPILFNVPTLLAPPPAPPLPPRPRPRPRPRPCPRPPPAISQFFSYLVRSSSPTSSFPPLPSWLFSSCPSFSSSHPQRLLRMLLQHLRAETSILDLKTSPQGMNSLFAQVDAQLRQHRRLSLRERHKSRFTVGRRGLGLDVTKMRMKWGMR